jgi:hypothetical protein
MKPANLTSRLLTRKGQASPTLVTPPRPTALAGELPLLRPKEPEGPSDPVPDGIALNRHTAMPRGAFDRRVHMSLRLDPGRHLRLRLEATRRGRSMHSLLIEALDDFLARDDSNGRAPQRPHGNGTGNGAGANDHGSRREPARTSGVETGGGSSRSQ